MDNLKIFLNATVVFNLAGCYTACSFKRAPCHYFSLGFCPIFAFMVPFKSFITLCSHPTRYFNVDYKTNNLAITYYYSSSIINYWYLYASALSKYCNKIYKTTTKQKTKNWQISDNGRLFLLIIFYWNKYLLWLVN